MAKTTFLATEKLYVSLEPFIDPTTGEYIESDDTVGADVVKPDGSTTTVSFTRNATSKIWTAEILVASYMQGKWEFRATSSDSSSPKPQFRVCWWGVGVEDAVPTIATDATAAAAAAASAETAAVTAASAAGDALSAATIAATQATTAATEAAGANTKASTLLTLATFLNKLNSNRWKIFGNQLVYYDDDNTTPILTFNLFDPNGDPTNTNIRERVPA